MTYRCCSRQMEENSHRLWSDSLRFRESMTHRRHGRFTGIMRSPWTATWAVAMAPLLLLVAVSASLDQPDSRSTVDPKQRSHVVGHTLSTSSNVYNQTTFTVFRITPIDVTGLTNLDVSCYCPSGQPSSTLASWCVLRTDALCFFQSGDAAGDIFCESTSPCSPHHFALSATHPPGSLELSCACSWCCTAVLATTLSLRFIDDMVRKPRRAERFWAAHGLH